MPCIGTSAPARQFYRESLEDEWAALVEGLADDPE